MAEVYSIGQVETAAGVSRRQIDAWVSRQHIHLADNPPNGEARNFTFLDAVNIAALAATVQLGIPPSRFWGGVVGMPGYLSAAGPGVLVIWHGPADKRWTPVEPPICAEICKHSDLAAKLNDPGKRATVVIDLEQIEIRLRSDLGEPRQGEIRLRNPGAIDPVDIYARLNARKSGQA